MLSPTFCAFLQSLFGAGGPQGTHRQGERSIKTSVIGYQAVRTWAVIVPARVVKDRVQADTLHRNTKRSSEADFIHYMCEPSRARIALYAGLGDEDRAAVTSVCFCQNPVERLVERMRAIDRRATMDPLIIVIEIDADDIQQIWSTTDLRP